MTRDTRTYPEYVSRLFLGLAVLVSVMLAAGFTRTLGVPETLFYYGVFGLSMLLTMSGLAWSHIRRETSSRLKSVLIVEQEEQLRATFSAFWEHQGWNVRTVASSIDALQMLSRSGSRYDLIIMDIVLPNINALELIKGLTESLPDQSIIVMQKDESKDAQGKHLRFQIVESTAPRSIHRLFQKLLREPTLSRVAGESN